MATWPGYGVHRYLPDRTLDAVLPLPVSNVSSCEFGGPDLRDLYITTAWELLSEEEHAAQPLAGSLFRYPRGAWSTACALRGLTSAATPGR